MNRSEQRKQRAGTRPENPVRGCLLVEKRGPKDNFLFVFRRRGSAVSTRPPSRSRVAGFTGFLISRRRKTKRKSGRTTVVSIIRQPLTGLQAKTPSEPCFLTNTPAPSRSKSCGA